jgi:hypothetical protein
VVILCCCVWQRHTGLFTFLTSSSAFLCNEDLARGAAECPSGNCCVPSTQNWRVLKGTDMLNISDQMQTHWHAPAGNFKGPRVMQPQHRSECLCMCFLSSFRCCMNGMEVVEGWWTCCVWQRGISSCLSPSSALLRNEDRYVEHFRQSADPPACPGRHLCKGRDSCSLKTEVNVCACVFFPPLCAV